MDNEVNENEVGFNVENDIITKRVSFSKETYKNLKIYMLNNGLWDEGKIAPEVLGRAVKMLLSEKK